MKPQIHNPDHLTPEQYGASEGWRLLYVGESRPEDYQWRCNGTWVDKQECIGLTVLRRHGFTYRTRTPDPYAEPVKQADGWIRMSERKPTEADLPVWYFSGQAVCGPYELISTGYSHWRPAEKIPAPPPRELTQAERDEEAFWEWFENQEVYCACQPELCAGWHAGIAKERAEIAKLIEDTPGDALDALKAVEARVKGTS